MTRDKKDLPPPQHDLYNVFTKYSVALEIGLRIYYINSHEIVLTSDMALCTRLLYFLRISVMYYIVNIGMHALVINAFRLVSSTTKR